MVPKSIAAMLPDGIRKPDSFLGTRFATLQPLDVFRTSPMFVTISVEHLIMDELNNMIRQYCILHTVVTFLLACCFLPLAEG